MRKRSRRRKHASTGRRPARELDCQIRGLSPFPGAWCEARGERLKILLAEPVAGQGTPGKILAGDLTVAAGDGALKLLRVQRAGKTAMTPKDLLRGFPLAEGDC